MKKSVSGFPSQEM